MREVQVDFYTTPTRRYRSLLHRSDGVIVEFDGGAYNRIGGPAAEVPHDIAHLIVEDELELRHGVWGVLAAGGLFKHTKVVSGRQRPQAKRHGQEVIARAGDRVIQSEMLTRVVCDVAAGDLPPDPDALRRAVGAQWWTGNLTPAALDRARDRLRDASTAWAALGPDEPLTFAWRLPRA